MLSACTSVSIRAQTCPDVEIKVATTRDEKEAAFALTYQSYLRAGLCPENRHGLRLTAYQLLSTTDIIIATLRGEVISTLSLVRDGALGLPMEGIYPEEVAARRACGMGVAEVSCLADRRQGAARFFGLFCEMSCLMAQLGRKQGVDELLVAVHPRHASLYRRYMAFQPIGNRRNYPAVQDRPAVALCLNFDAAKTDSPGSWQKFFGLPLPEDALTSCPMSEDDREYFSTILAETGCDMTAQDRSAAPADGDLTRELRLLCA